MNQFIRAVGFKEYNTRKKIRQLLSYVQKNAARIEEYPIHVEETLRVYEMDVADCVGITVVSMIDEDGFEEIESYFPYVKGLNFLFHDHLEFEPFHHKTGYACICDDNNIGIPLIFHVNNIVEYLNMKKQGMGEDINSIVLSGIAQEGIVILSVEKDEYQLRKEERENEIRNQRIDAAKAGDVEAMERLTLEDMDTYTMVNNRSKTEDIFTIVTSYFMPYSIECDQYSILGNIIAVNEIANKITGEQMYYISVECNSIQIEIVIAKNNIVGIPEPGRRFKGHIWLQGEIDCM